VEKPSEEEWGMVEEECGSAARVGVYNPVHA